MAGALARSRCRTGRAGPVAESAAASQFAPTCPADSRPLFGLSRARRPRSQILRVLQRLDCRQITFSWAFGSAGPADRQLHSLALGSQPRTSVESSLPARTWVGCAAGRQLGGRSRTVLDARQ